MVGSKSSLSTGLCWADEVEKEEEESRTLVQKSKKPNPFGSARPREVVLQEKGIDWRKLDDPSSIPREKKQPTENVPAPREPVSGRKLQSPPTKGIEQNVENQLRAGSLMFQDENVDPLVPPLRFPPKNIMDLMKGQQLPTRGDGVKPSLPKTVEFNSEQLRENRLYELAIQRSLESKKLDDSLRGSHCRSRSSQFDRDIVWDEENSGYENRGSFSVQKLRHGDVGEIRNVRSSSVHGEREWKNMNDNSTRKHFFEDHSMGLKLGRGRRASIAGDWRDEDNGYERMNGCGERLRWSPPITDLPNGGRHEYRYLNEEQGTENLRYMYPRQRSDARDYEGDQLVKVDQGTVEYHRDMDMKKAGFQVNSRNVQLRPFEERRTNNMGYSYARQRSDSRDFEGDGSVQMGRGRAKDYQDMDTKQAEFGMNNKKRGIKSVSNTARYHQRRRQ